MRTGTIIGAVLAAGLALAACSSGEEPSDEPPAPGTPPPITIQIGPGPISPGNSAEHGVAEEHTSTDREFAQQLLAHREQTLQLAILASRTSSNREIGALATRITEAGQPQVDQIKAWLASTGGQNSASAPEDSTDDQDIQSGALQSPQQLQQLGRLRGSAFDQQWTRTVIALHESSLNLARTELEEGQDPQMRGVAERIVAAQQEELDDLRQLQP